MSDAAAEKRLELMSSARLVNIAWGEIKPLIDAQRASAIARLTQDFRAGVDAQKFYQHVATLTVLEDLETQVRQKLRAGEQAAKETMNA